MRILSNSAKFSAGRALLPAYNFSSHNISLDISLFTGRRQAVFSCGEQSQWSLITRSIVQGSGIGPSAYLVYSMDLKALSEYNSIIKFADDYCTCTSV